MGKMSYFEKYRRIRIEEKRGIKREKEGDCEGNSISLPKSSFLFFLHFHFYFTLFC
jgi:hypothetical protein